LNGENRRDAAEFCLYRTGMALGPSFIRHASSSVSTLMEDHGKKTTENTTINTFL
jgi:hypothetical protein